MEEAQIGRTDPSNPVATLPYDADRGQVCELAGDRENAIADYKKALSKKNPALTPKGKFIPVSVNQT